jgi:hypothetical protein
MDWSLATVFAFTEPLHKLLGSLLLLALFYWPGRLILRFISRGRYPPGWAEKHDVSSVAILGFIVFLVAFTVFYS